MKMSWDAACGQNIFVFDDEEDFVQFVKDCDQLIYGIKKGEEIMKKDYRDVIQVWNRTGVPYDYFYSELAQIDYTINGYKVWIDTTKWDGNVAGIMRAIYDSCGYMENHLYHKVKANVEMIKRKRKHKVESTPLVSCGIKNVIFEEPATIVYWVDGSKTVVICQEGDIYDEEKGLAMAIAKKALGNNYAAGGRFKKAFKNAIRRK